MIDQINIQFVSRFRFASFLLSLVAVIFGLSVILGYIIEGYFGPSGITHNLKAVFPNLPVAMNPATAFAFVISGFSLIILLKMPDREWLRRAGAILAIMVLLIGAIKLAGIISSQNVYFDKIFFSNQLEAEGLITGRPNQIAPNTALNFMFIGIALTFLYIGRLKLAHYFASATFFIGLLAVLGYMYGVSRLIGIAQYIPMALNTAVAFEAISLAVLLAFPARGLMTIGASDSAGGIISRKLIPAAVILPALLGYITFFSVSRNFYPVELGLALLVVGNIVFFVFLISREALVIHRVDAELKEEKARAESLLESIGEGLIATDSAFKILVMNPAAEAMLGWDADEAVGKKMSSDLPVIQDELGNSVPLEKQPFMQTLKSGKKVEVNITSKEKYYYVRKDGTKFPISITATPIILDSKIIGMIVVFRDITAEVEFDKKKSEFISLASHQLKTPPTAMKWNLENLLDDAQNLNSKQKEILQDVYSMSRKMIETVEVLLNASRIEMGSFIIDPKPVGYADVAKEVIKEQKPKIEAKKLKLEESYDSDIPLIPADPGLAKIVVENLISNAVKYTPDNGIVKIKIQYLEADKKIKIIVADTGVGIPKNQQGQIFTKMFRASNVKEGIDGTGFGLYLLKSIVDVAGGRVWFESEENEGTTFYIELPISGMKKQQGTSRLSRIA